MFPSTNSAEYSSPGEPKNLVWFSKHVRNPKKKFTAKNVQTENRSGQNVPTSTDDSTDRHVAGHERQTRNTTFEEKENEKNLTREETKDQEVESLREDQSGSTNGQPEGTLLWCTKCWKKKSSPPRSESGKLKKLKLCRKKKTRGSKGEKSVQREPTNGVSTYQESVESASKKARKTRRKHGPPKEKLVDDSVVDRPRKSQDKKSKKKSERRISEVSYEPQAERDERLIRNHFPEKHPPTDIEKSCCYLCARNAAAIATFNTNRSNQYTQISMDSPYREISTSDKNCGPTSCRMRTVQSSVRVKTREIGTLCSGTKAKSKLKEFGLLFWKLKRSKCPSRNATCETDRLGRIDGKKCVTERICCKEKNS